MAANVLTVEDDPLPSAHMFPAKLAVASSLAVIVLTGCGSIAVEPVAGSGSSKPVSRGRVDDPRTHQPNHLQCLTRAHLQVVEEARNKLQVGAPSSGPTIVFAPTPGIAQGEQIQAQQPGAEVIGSALLYPNRAPDTELKTIEDCLARGVSG
jgi:hypothetical protein